jgi:pseudaminic acid synthase
MRSIKIEGRSIGVGHPVYIVAEMSANHNHSYDQAVRLIQAAKSSGADAIKLQTYTADTITIKCDQPQFWIKEDSLWKGRNLYDLYEEAHTPWEWQPKLMKIAKDLGLDFFSSPFDKTAVDFLEGLEVPLYKVASLELVDLPLLRYIARIGKPIILSTGTSTMEEIEEAVATIRKEGVEAITLLKCTSAYPAPYEEMNLNTIPNLAETFKIPVGLSDHSLGITISAAAVALGASVIEKHLTLSRNQGGPDSGFSLEPNEFKQMVEAVRTTEKALGKIKYGATLKEKASLTFRRSLFVVEDIKVGGEISNLNVRSIRPGHGLQPKYFDQILGRRVVKDVLRGTPVTWDLFK